MLRFGKSDFLRTKITNNPIQLSIEFKTNSKLLEVQISSRDVNTRITKHINTCPQVDQNMRKQARSHEGKPNYGHNDLFAEVHQLAPKLSTSPLRELELLTSDA
jgi:hypothetical protein